MLSPENLPIVLCHANFEQDPAVCKQSFLIRVDEERWQKEKNQACIRVGSVQHSICGSRSKEDLKQSKIKNLLKTEKRGLTKMAASNIISTVLCGRCVA